MDENNKNFILAIVLSMAILVGWYQFVVGPKQTEIERQKRQAQEQVKKPEASKQGIGAPQVPADKKSGASQPVSVPKVVISRKEALSASSRVKIQTASLQGSISLKGARIDDLVLQKYRETVKKDSKNVTLLSPSGSPHPYYTEHGWAANAVKTPSHDTIWKVAGNDTLTEKSPVTLVYDNGEGLVFKRTISVDENYMFTVRQEVENKTDKPVVLYPWALVSRHSKPKTTDIFILHEGLVGVMGEQSLVEVDYDTAVSEATTNYKDKGGWLGITDKYWATVVIPDQKFEYSANFSGRKENSRKIFQTDYTARDGVTIAAGNSAHVTGYVFAGAKQTNLINSYGEKYNILKFGLMIDWGWFDFLTKPLFYALDFFNKFFGNYGLSILFVTVIIKLIMYPLANKSYESMSKMKKLQPEMQRIKERFKDDAVRQQKETMELYKKEKINPMAGCLPIFIQIPVFFALYKVLFITIDMRHAPFFGWIRDLSAPDPTNIFNLFGLLPFDPPFPFQVGIWAIIMGLTMWVQMRLNPQQADPMQQAIFNWMPIIFTFMLATFPAGLVIYWAWNNLLSIIQQRYIMHKNGVDVNLIENTGLDKLWGLYKSYTGANKT